MMKFMTITCLALMLGLCSCESLITDIDEDKLPATGSKLVVQSFISPQAIRTHVVVTESVPLFGDETSATGKAIPTATVTISDGVNEARIPFDPVSQLYGIDREDFAITAGKTYYLTVTDGNRTINAKCTVPVRVATVQSYEIDTSFSRNLFDQDTSVTVQMTWQDIAADTNYYRVRATMDLEYSIPEGTNAENFKEKRVKNRFNFDWDQTVGRNDFQSDANLDGALFTSAIGRATLPNVTIYDYGNGNRFTVYPKSKIIAINLEVYNTDENYFKYHRSLELRGNSDNPFTEPALIYSNINRGLGCFAAYNSGLLQYRP